MILFDGSDETNYFYQGLLRSINLPSKKTFLKVHKDKTKNKNLHNKQNTKVEEPERDVNKEPLILIGTIKKKSLLWLREELLKQYQPNMDFEHILIVIVDYFKDSMIQSKYIKNTLLKGQLITKDPSFLFIEFVESDYITRIEDGYNECFSNNHLSKGYKKKLVLATEFLKTKKNGLQSEIDRTHIIQQKGGIDYADSSLV